ncbi:hypothetical protein Pf1_01753 [Flavobacterium columnare]|nr:hypothetical protein Pf1_01753 [Flavobacterium columnare]APT22118.1 hypothetical protein BU993_05405 [Flavobacterium columnare]
MRLALLVFFILLKNIILLHLYTRNKRFDTVYFIVSFFILLFFFYLNSFWINNEITEAIPVIVCIDFFLLIFIKFLKFYNKIIDNLLKKTNNELINPFIFISSFNLNVNSFYLFITFLEVLFLFICL